VLTHRWSWPCFALLALIAAGGSAAAQTPAPPEREAAARRAFEAGREAYDRGRFAEALGSFDRAYALSANPILLYNIGRAAEAELRTERAIGAYQAYLAALPKADNREFVEARLTKLRQLHQSQQSVRSREEGRRPPASAPAPAAVEASPPSLSSEPAPPAAAERGLGGVRLHAGMRFGLGGKWSADYDDGWLGKDERDLGGTFGFQVGASQFWRYVGIGGELRVNMFKVDAVSDRLKTLDLVALPRGGYRLETLPLEFYGALPIGMSVPLFDDDVSIECACGSPQAADFKVGMTIGAVAGASYFFSDHVGINVEVGWLMHRYDFADDDDDSGLLKIKQGNLLTTNVV
jgi:hypothetical protein